MRLGTSRNSGRNAIWTYIPGPALNRYSQLHPAFVSQNLLIADGLEITRSEISALLLDWRRTHFNPNFIRTDYKDLHNLCRYLLTCQGVEEVGDRFIGVGPRT